MIASCNKDIVLEGTFTKNEMNELIKENTISSREVATMMEKRHDHLLRDIEKHTAILEKVTEPNFGVSNLWQLSNYKDSTGRTLKEYQVTKSNKMGYIDKCCE